jgi:hypothetical protein
MPSALIASRPGTKIASRIGLGTQRAIRNTAATRPMPIRAPYTAQKPDAVVSTLGNQPRA